MFIDQAPERCRGVTEVPFLGALASVDLAPALAAMRARVPLVAAFPVRHSDGSHGLVVARVIEPPERPSRAWAVDAMVEATRALEEFVHAHPEQWLWMHRRWKAPPVRRSSDSLSTARAPASRGACAGNAES
jgi:KDO2-lipid IV(A) lauroyltransferase